MPANRPHPLPAASPWIGKLRSTIPFIAKRSGSFGNAWARQIPASGNGTPRAHIPSSFPTGTRLLRLAFPARVSVGPQQVNEAAKEAVLDISFDTLIVCGFA